MAFSRTGAFLMTWFFMTRDISVFPGLPSELASGPASLGMAFESDTLPEAGAPPACASAEAAAQPAGEEPAAEG